MLIPKIVLILPSLMFGVLGRPLRRKACHNGFWFWENVKIPSLIVLLLLLVLLPDQGTVGHATFSSDAFRFGMLARKSTRKIQIDRLQGKTTPRRRFDSRIRFQCQLIIESIRNAIGSFQDIPLTPHRQQMMMMIFNSDLGSL